MGWNVPRGQYGADALEPKEGSEAVARRARTPPDSLGGVAATDIVGNTCGSDERLGPTRPPRAAPLTGRSCPMAETFA